MQKSSYLELRNIQKSFGPVQANAQVSFQVAESSIHAIVGENGAGKSTAMKILYGQYMPDGGEILLAGKRCHWSSSADAIAAGFGMVHQHFMLAETHTALENILLGTHHFPYLRRHSGAARKKIQALMQEFGLEIPLDTPVEELPVGMQQKIEILKLLYRDSKVLILDEPTAVLAPAEIEGLFRILRALSAKGKTILIITHKLKEVMALAEKVTIFRAGRVVGEREVQHTSIGEISGLMMGQEVQAPTEKERSPARHDLVLEAKAVKAGKNLGPVSFRIRAGEILGIAGVEGNGQSELLRLLLDPKRNLKEGSLRFQEKSVERFSAAKIRELGTAVFPEDRLKEGLLLDFSLAENFLLGHEQKKEFRWGPFLLRKKIRNVTQGALHTYDVRPPLVEAKASDLSGGNQQKLVVARELWQQPKLLLASKPTRGVDIGAIAFIHKKILDLREQGTAVLLISSELEELFTLADRLLVLYRGQVVGSFLREEFNEKTVGALMAGAAL